MLSPVCMPMGSKFSIEHIITTLSFKSLITSSSNSFQPRTDCSINISCLGERLRPHSTYSSSSSMLYATFPPVPPRVKDGLIIAGNPILLIAAFASSIVLTYSLSGRLSPILLIAILNSFLSSAILIAFSFAPISSTPYLFSAPFSESSTAIFNAVWPPIVGSRASGLSFSIILSTISGVIGSIYVLSAVSGSVIIVAGLEFISTTSYPSSRKALQACVPE